MKLAPCQNCGMKGIVEPKMTVETDNFDGTFGPAIKKELCVTCFETPMGRKSDNVGHQRLAEGEYK